MRASSLLAPVAALLVALLSGCATGPSPTQVRLDNLDTRVSKIERVVSSGSLVQLAQQEDALQAEVRDLRGRLDRLRRDNQRLSRQQRDLYAALSKRVSALEHASAAAPPASASSAASGTASAASGAGAASGASPAGLLPGVTAKQQAAYKQAFNLLEAGHYSKAARGFGGFLKTYPASPLAPNAEYWLGETHYVNQDFDQAERSFRTVLKKWPHSGKAPAALFDLGNTLIAQGRVREGRAELREVVKRYPGTQLAKRAASILKHGH